MRKLVTLLAAVVVASIPVEIGAIAAENFKKLSGSQIPREVHRDATHAADARIAFPIARPVRHIKSPNAGGANRASS